MNLLNHSSYWWSSYCSKVLGYFGARSVSRVGCHWELPLRMLVTRPLLDATDQKKDHFERATLADDRDIIRRQQTCARWGQLDAIRGREDRGAHYLGQHSPVAMAIPPSATSSLAHWLTRVITLIPYRTTLICLPPNTAKCSIFSPNTCFLVTISGSIASHKSAKCAYQWTLDQAKVYQQFFWLPNSPGKPAHEPKSPCSSISSSLL